MLNRVLPLRIGLHNQRKFSSKDYFSSTMKIVALVFNNFKMRGKWLPYKIQVKIHAVKLLTPTVLITSRFSSIDDRDNQPKEITVLSMMMIERVKVHVQTTSK